MNGEGLIGMEMTTTDISKSMNEPINLHQTYLWVPINGPGSIFILFASVILMILRIIHVTNFNIIERTS